MITISKLVARLTNQTRVLNTLLTLSMIDSEKAKEYNDMYIKIYSDIVSYIELGIVFRSGVDLYCKSYKEVAEILNALEDSCDE